MDHDDVITVIDGYDIAVQDDIQRFADRYREHRLLPFCEKYGLDFTSGMGTFFFTTADGKNIEAYKHDVDENTGPFWDTYRLIMKELTMLTPDRFELGLGVYDIRTQD